MSPRFPLQPLLDLSQLRLDEATRKLGELMNGQQEAQKRVDLLVEYRAEYQARFTAAAQSGIGPSEWQNFRSFLAKLDQAVEQARQMLEHTRQNTRRGQQAWLEKRSQVKAYDTLADRHRQQLARHDQRREQKASDEHAARRFFEPDSDLP